MATASVTPNAAHREISPGRWVGIFLAFALVIPALQMFVAWRLDFFGIFRDTHGRSLITSEHERKAKYFLNESYVPNNFDALVLGASPTVNLRMGDLKGFHFYDESLEGGDASEERRLVERALPTGHFKLALVGLYPRITSLHLLQDGFDNASRVEALGSISSLDLELNALIGHVHPRPAKYYPDGSHEFPVHAPPGSNAAGALLNMTTDAVAASDYETVVRELVNKGARIIYVASPLYEPHLQLNKAVMASYMEWVAQNMPSAPVIDFNTPDYAAFRNDSSNYIDEIHLSHLGAARLSKLLNDRMQQILQNPR